MHLINNETQKHSYSSPFIKSKLSSHTHLTKSPIPKSKTRAQTSKNNKKTTQTQSQVKTQTNTLTRVLSSAKSTIQRFMSPAKSKNEDNLKKVGDKYVYHSDDLIGKGYSSNVYKGSNVQNLQNKNLAIKILDLSKIQGFLLDLLKKQISIHRSLDHPNIVKCIDVIQTPTHIYLIQEYCSGGDLSSYISQRKEKIPQGNALNIMSQIVDGYKYLIERKILHRDLKPSNIFRCKMNEKWKIGDFGFSCYSYEQPDDINVGTPIYMPPQSLEKSLYSHKSDIFSLGVIMYEIVYGRVPWFSKSQSLLVKKMRENKLNLDNEKLIIKNPLIKKFIYRCCEIDEQLRISETQFLKLQLYPKRPQQIKCAKKDQSSVSVNKQKLTQNNQHENNKKQEISLPQQILQSQTLNKKIHSSSFKPLTQRKQSQTENIDKVSKTSQYSTEAQTRVINEMISCNFQQLCKSNSEILLKQNNFCKHLYFMVKNLQHFLLSDLNKQLLMILIYRHIIYILKKLKNSKFNYFQLKKWQSYKLSKEYAAFHKEVSVNLQRIQAEYMKNLKRKEIKILREIDVKFKELDYEVELNFKFYAKIRDWLRSLIEQFKQRLVNLYNLNGKKQEKNIAKDLNEKSSQQDNENGLKQSVMKMGQKIKSKMITIPNSQDKNMQSNAVSKNSEDLKDGSIKKKQAIKNEEIFQNKQQKNQQVGQELECLVEFDDKSEYIIKKLPHNNLQSLLSLLQYQHLMDSKISKSQQAHTSYSMIDLHQGSESQNMFSLIRQYKKVNFTQTQLQKIANLAKL